MFDLSDHNKLKEGVDTRDRVREIMGSPTLVTDLNLQESWIYFSEDVRYLLFFKPKVITREIVVIDFDRFNLVKNIRNYNLANQLNNLDFFPKFTFVESHKSPGFFKSIYSNVGQIKPQ